MSGVLSTEQLFDSDWKCLLSLMPTGWQEAARESGAFCWGRQVRSAEDLLRLSLAYASEEMSLRTTAAWAQQRELVSSLSDVALLKRLKRAQGWLSWLVEHKLMERVRPPEWVAPGLRIRLLDATTVGKPGSTGTDWRIHLSFGLATWQIDSVEVTDARGGETLQRVRCEPGDIVVADRIYPNRAGIHSVVTAGAHVLVRMTWQNLPLQSPDGQPFDLFAHLRTLAPGEAGDWDVVTVPDRRADIPSMAGRVVAVRKSEQAAERSRQRLRHDARKKGKTPSQESLEAVGYVFVFTTLCRQEFEAAWVLETYRFRWQIELVFKRMKSLLHLDEMSARCPELCRSFLLAKLLMVLLIEDLSRRYADFSPWGYGRPATALAVAAVPGPG